MAAADYYEGIASWGTGIREYSVFENSWVSLREVSVGYNLPKKWWGKLPIRGLTLSAVGRNLAILHMNVPNIDPESSYTSSNSQGLDYFGMPATRTFGFNLRATF